MMDSTDMSTPVTRGELQGALKLFQRELTLERQHELQAAVAPLATKTELQAAVAPLATRTELQAAVAPLATKAELHQEIQAAIAPLATKAELELWGGALLERIKQSEVRFTESLQQSEQRLLAELTRHTSAIHEAMRVEIKASFEPLADLPGRVSRLEAAVFGPTPRKTRARRRSP